MIKTSNSNTPNKRKILNDPVYGFVTVPNALIYDLIEHPYFQRLRRIRQVGMSSLVYPGANHSRFHHALGAMHLMQLAIDQLRQKGVEISPDEETGALIAILLHDIGHGPFSHSLEFTLVKNVKHEVLSGLLMDRLNEHFSGALRTGIAIFRGKYRKRFLHQLVSSQLDMDRLDYLSRDSFYTGVSEGVISNQRIIKMLNVVNDSLVVEEKGIYSIEKFIIARRLMYWQVYLHKTVISSEKLLISILERAKYCARKGLDLFASPALRTFLYDDFSKEDFIQKTGLLESFASLDDYDILGAIKVWAKSEDRILSDLCTRLVQRKLLAVVISNGPPSDTYIQELRGKTAELFDLKSDEISYYFQVGKIRNNAYDLEEDGIGILHKNGDVSDITEASDNRALLAQAEAVEKHIIYLPKEVRNKG